MNNVDLPKMTLANKHIIDLLNFSAKLVNACASHYNIYAEEIPVLLQPHHHHIYKIQHRKLLHGLVYMKSKFK